MKIIQGIFTTTLLAIVFKSAASALPISGQVADARTGEAIIGATVYDPYNKEV